MKKVFSLVLVFLMVFSSFGGTGIFVYADDNSSTAVASGEDVTITASGTCGAEGDGSNLTWTLDSQGVLTISGTGTMPNYPMRNEPWWNYYKSINSVNIEEGVTVIGQYAFEYCENLERVTIPSSVSTIGDCAFIFCNKLDTVYYSGSIKSWGQIAIGLNNGPLNNANIIFSISIIASGTCGAEDDGSNVTWTLDSAGVLTISGSGAMQENGVNAPWKSYRNNIISVVIEPGVTSIQDYAFYYCRNMVSISIPESVTVIPKYMCGYCESLKTVNLPSSITSIKDRAFDYSGLTTITIPDGVTNIAYGAFSRCGSLQSVSLSDGVKFDADPGNIFDYSTNLIEINVSGGNPYYTSINGVLYNKDVTSLIYCPEGVTNVFIPNTVTTIGERAFYHSSVTNISIPNTVTTIENSAFEWSAITSITIPNGVTVIGGYAFLKTGLMSIIIPNSVTYLGDGVFSDCANLQSVTLPDGIAFYPIDPYGRYLWSVFHGCVSLAEINVGEGNPYYSSINGVLYNKDITSLIYCPAGVTTISIPDTVTTIGDNAFDSSSVTSITIPNSVTQLGEFAFSGSSVVSVTIPDSVTSIGAYAFEDCANLVSVRMPERGTLIGRLAFDCCNSLTSIMIPDGNTVIERETFQMCVSLKSVIIPASITAINDFAFISCDQIDNVYFLGTSDDWSQIAIGEKNGSLKDAAIHYEFTKHPATPAGFETEGYIEHWTDADGNYYIVTPESVTKTTAAEVTLPVASHDWGEPTYTWSDGNRIVTATRVCNNDANHVETETVSATYEVTSQATCAALGVGTWISDTFTNEAFTIQTKDVEIPMVDHTAGDLVRENEVAATCETAGSYDSVTYCSICGAEINRETIELSAIGHGWGETIYTWADDNSTVTATRVCNNDASHVETETVSATYEVTAQATCTAVGVGTWTSAGFANDAFIVQTKYVDLPTVNHTPGDPVHENEYNGYYDSVVYCTVCGTELSRENVKAPVTVIASGNCGAEGDGSNVTWSLDSDGVLTISGTGAMAESPWRDERYLYSIKSVVIEQGVTTLLWDAFKWCWINNMSIPAGIVYDASTACIRPETAADAEAFAALLGDGLSGNVTFEGTDYSKVKLTKNNIEYGPYDIVYADLDAQIVTDAKSVASQLFSGLDTFVYKWSGELAHVLILEDLDLFKYDNTDELLASMLPEGYSVRYLNVVGDGSILGGAGYAEIELCYNDIVVADLGPLITVRRNVVYVPSVTENTPDALAAAATNRINNEFGLDVQIRQGLVPDDLDYDPIEYFSQDYIEEFSGIAPIETPAYWFIVDYGDEPLYIVISRSDKLSNVTIQDDVVITDSLAEAGLDTSEKVEAKFADVVAQMEGFSVKNSTVCDVSIKIRSSFDGTWVDLTSENFPEDGVCITLPYPEGTSASNDFVIVHMFAADMNEHLAGDTETITPEKTEGGLVIKVNSLSPFSIAWAAHEPEFSVAGANMTLGNELSMNFFVRKTDIDASKDYYITVRKTYADNRADVTVTYPFSEWEDYSDTYYSVKFNGVAAKEMNDLIYVQVFHADGTPATDVWEDSVAKYVLRIFDKQNDKTKAMLADMLNYGSAAQTFFSYNTNNLANSVLSEEQLSYATASVVATDSRVKGEYYYGSNLNLGSNLQLSMYFKDLSSDMYAVIAFTDHYGTEKSCRIEGSSFEVYSSANAVYRIYIDQIVVADARQPVTCTVYNADGTEFASATDSIESYIARMSSGSELYEAILKFADSAYNHFHQ